MIDGRIRDYPVQTKPVINAGCCGQDVEKGYGSLLDCIDRLDSVYVAELLNEVALMEEALRLVCKPISPTCDENKTCGYGDSCEASIRIIASSNNIDRATEMLRELRRRLDF